MKETEFKACRPLVAVATTLLGAFMPVAAPGYYNDFDSAPFHYSSTPATDPMTLLLQEEDHGMGDRTGLDLVRHLLEKLGIPASSQVLVFSKTSLQTAVVSPANPRAIYFNDDVYLGWMPGGRIEIASDDPKLGPIFHFEGQRDLDSARPGPVTFDRPRRCLGCHAGSPTDFIPGVFAQSNYVNREGRARGKPAPWENVHDSTPFEERWGGWFVTGAPPSMPHLGNRFFESGGGPSESPHHPGDPVNDLSRFFPSDRYAHEGSNVVPLMVFDHQVGFHDLLTRARYKVRYFLHEENPEAGEDAPLTGEALEVATDQADRIVRALLFMDALPFDGAETAPDAQFMKDFSARGPFDSEGRSLREFGLSEGRLFRHRCSYMIHSNAFRGLPAALKRLVFDRLHRILVEPEPTAADEPAVLPSEERAAIASILRATVPDLTLSESWREESTSAGDAK